MDEQTLEDLLAFVEVRNITLAARRRNVSQPAYSRRLMAIEAAYGISLVERSVRPAHPTPALDAMREEMEFVLAGMKRLGENMANKAAVEKSIAIAALHTLSAGPIPAALKMISGRTKQQRIRLRSANQNTCFQMLMIEEVSVMMAYETTVQVLHAPHDLVKKTVIATDFLVPVCAPELVDKISATVPGTERIALIAYPRDNFLGRVLFDEILANTPHQFSDVVVAGFTSAVMTAVREGIGMAWLPHSLVKKCVTDGELVVLDNPLFPTIDLKVMMLHLRTKNTAWMRPWLAVLAETMASTMAVSRGGSVQHSESVA